MSCGVAVRRVFGCALSVTVVPSADVFRVLGRHEGYGAHPFDERAPQVDDTQLF